MYGNLIILCVSEGEVGYVENWDMDIFSQLLCTHPKF